MTMMIVSLVAFAAINLMSEFARERVIPDEFTTSAPLPSTLLKSGKEDGSESTEERQLRLKQTYFVFCLLIGMQAYLCFFSNGFFPSIQVNKLFIITRDGF